MEQFSGKTNAISRAAPPVSSAHAKQFRPAAYACHRAISARWGAQQGNKALRQLECRLSGCLALADIDCAEEAQLICSRSTMQSYDSFGTGIC